MTNTEKAIEFLQLASSGRVRDAYDRHTGERFKHHNAHFAAGADALRNAMEEAHRTDPNKGLDVQRTVADGNYVWVHSRVRKEARVYVAVHIFRFDAGRVAELWDVAAEVPARSPNTDGAF
jgi:predicted SnoaL-like aldol condensation-catalyzing enzyme